MFDRNCIVIINGESYKDIDITYIVYVYICPVLACLSIFFFHCIYFQHLGINESYLLLITSCINLNTQHNVWIYVISDLCSLF